MNITIRDCPKEIFEIIQKRRLDHLNKCNTCKYGLGQATVAYIRELQRKAEITDRTTMKMTTVKNPK